MESTFSGGNSVEMAFASLLKRAYFKRSEFAPLVSTPLSEGGMVYRKVNKTESHKYGLPCGVGVVCVGGGGCEWRKFYQVDPVYYESIKTGYFYS